MYNLEDYLGNKMRLSAEVESIKSGWSSSGMKTIWLVYLKDITTKDVSLGNQTCKVFFNGTRYVDDLSSGDIISFDAEVGKLERGKLNLKCVYPLDKVEQNTTEDIDTTSLDKLDQVIEYLKTGKVKGLDNKTIDNIVKQYTESSWDCDYLFRYFLIQSGDKIGHGKKSTYEKVLKKLKPILYFVYKLYDSNGEVIYVGSSSSIQNRLKSHYHSKDFEYVEVCKCSNKIDMLRLEHFTIKSLFPQLNKDLNLTLAQDYLPSEQHVFTSFYDADYNYIPHLLPFIVGCKVRKTHYKNLKGIKLLIRKSLLTKKSLKL